MSGTAEDPIPAKEFPPFCCNQETWWVGYTVKGVRFFCKVCGKIYFISYETLGKIFIWVVSQSDRDLEAAKAKMDQARKIGARFAFLKHARSWLGTLAEIQSALAETEEKLKPVQKQEETEEKPEEVEDLSLAEIRAMIQHSRGELEEEGEDE